MAVSNTNNHPSRKKIAIFSGSIPSSTFVEALILGLAKHHDVLLFGVVGQPTTYTSKHIRVIQTPRPYLINFILTFKRSLLLLVKRPNHLFQLFQEISNYHRLYDRWIWYSKFLPIILYQPDIFHIQWARDLEFYTFLKTRFDIPLVVSLRGAHINYTPILNLKVADVYKTTFPYVDAFHAVSKAMAIEAGKYGNITPKLRVIYSLVPSHFFEAYASYKKQSNSKLAIVSVGRFHWKKGYRYALDALRLLKDKGYDVSYTIIGSQYIPDAVTFQNHQLQLEDTFEVVPNMNQHALSTFLKTKDVLLLSSVEEGIANVVLEAMALGIPVISTNCGGMPEVVIPNETGWLVPVRDPDAIAKAVIEVSQTSELELQRITKNAHDFVKTHFNAEDSITQFLELYESVYKESNGQIPTSLRSSE